MVKYPSVAKATNVDTTFLDCSTVPTLNLELETAALGKVLRNGTSNL